MKVRRQISLIKISVASVTHSQTGAGGAVSQIGLTWKILEVRTSLEAKGIQIRVFLQNLHMLLMHSLPVVDLGEHLPVCAFGHPLVMCDDFGKFRPTLWFEG